MESSPAAITLANLEEMTFAMKMKKAHGLSVTSGIEAPKKDRT